VIREGNTQMIDSIIQSGKGDGMQGMDDALAAALEAGKITPRDAHLKARDKARFEGLVPDEG
jgi:twitching motility protein PilT